MSLNVGCSIECDNCGHRATGLRLGESHKWIPVLEAEGWRLDPSITRGPGRESDLCPRCAQGVTK